MITGAMDDDYGDYERTKMFVPSSAAAESLFLLI